MRSTSRVSPHRGQVSSSSASVRRRVTAHPLSCGRDTPHTGTASHVRSRNAPDHHDAGPRGQRAWPTSCVLRRDTGTRQVPGPRPSSHTGDADVGRPPHAEPTCSHSHAPAVEPRRWVAHRPVCTSTPHEGSPQNCINSPHHAKPERTTAHRTRPCHTQPCPTLPRPHQTWTCHTGPCRASPELTAPDPNPPDHTAPNPTRPRPILP